MSGKDLTRAHDLRKLFEQQLDKVDHGKDHAGRMKEAASLMDKLVGAEWRGEVKLPGVEIIEIEVVGEGSPAADAGSFYDKVHGAMSAEGMDYKDDEDLDAHEAKEKRQDKPAIMCQIMKLMERLTNL